ncbi:MAG: hypothetical protein ACI8PZ_003003 [Myxococcota bacterium]|jgi:hypothetical protein
MTRSFDIRAQDPATTVFFTVLAGWTTVWLTLALPALL